MNPNAIAFEWFVDSSFLGFGSPFVSDLLIDVVNKTTSYQETEMGHKARRLIDNAKEQYSKYLMSGKITDELLESILILAQIEMMRRSGRSDDNLGITHSEDINDLRNLFAIVEPEKFVSQNICLLNPSFGEASKLVGGADADLLVDETLIDIKTTKNLQLKRDDFDQLLGYVALNEISAIGSQSPKPTISKIAIYYSRYSFLHTMNLIDIINDDTYGDFIVWFARTAEDVKKMSRFTNN